MQCSITMMSSCTVVNRVSVQPCITMMSSCTVVNRVSVQSFQLFSARKSLKVGMDGYQWFVVCSCCMKHISQLGTSVYYSTLLERLPVHFGISGTVFSMVQIIHFKQTATRAHIWLTFTPTRSSFRRPARVCPWSFSVLFIHNVNQSND